MRTRAEYTARIPEYALPAIINDDFSGLDPADAARINQYMSQFYEEAETLNATVIVSPTEDESHFTWNPAFGLACNVTECTILLLAN